MEEEDVMDYHSLKRKKLQALCKKHGLPANLSNREMADRLSLILQEIKKVTSQAASSLKNSAEKSREDNSKVATKAVKKVKFSPENQTFFYEVSNYKRDGRRSRPVRQKQTQAVQNEIISSPVGRKRRRDKKNKHVDTKRTIQSNANELSDADVIGGLVSRELRSRKVAVEKAGGDFGALGKTATQRGSKKPKTEVSEKNVGARENAKVDKFPKSRGRITRSHVLSDSDVFESGDLQGKGDEVPQFKGKGRYALKQKSATIEKGRAEGEIESVVESNGNVNPGLTRRQLRTRQLVIKNYSKDMVVSGKNVMQRDTKNASNELSEKNIISGEDAKLEKVPKSRRRITRSCALSEGTISESEDVPGKHKRVPQLQLRIDMEDALMRRSTAPQKMRSISNIVTANDSESCKSVRLSERYTTKDKCSKMLSGNSRTIEVANRSTRAQTKKALNASRADFQSDGETSQQEEPSKGRRKSVLPQKTNVGSNRLKEKNEKRKRGACEFEVIPESSKDSEMVSNVSIQNGPSRRTRCVPIASKSTVSTDSELETHRTVEKKEDYMTKEHLRRSTRSMLKSELNADTSEVDGIANAEKRNRRQKPRRDPVSNETSLSESKNRMERPLRRSSRNTSNRDLKEVGGALGNVIPKRHNSRSTVTIIVEKVPSPEATEEAAVGKNKSNVAEGSENEDTLGGKCIEQVHVSHNKKRAELKGKAGSKQAHGSVEISSVECDVVETVDPAANLEEAPESALVKFSSDARDHTAVNCAKKSKEFAFVANDGCNLEIDNEISEGGRHQTCSSFSQIGDPADGNLVEVGVDDLENKVSPAIDYSTANKFDDLTQHSNKVCLEVIEAEAKSKTNGGTSVQECKKLVESEETRKTASKPVILEAVVEEHQSEHSERCSEENSAVLHGKDEVSAIVPSSAGGICCRNKSFEAIEMQVTVASLFITSESHEERTEETHPRAGGSNANEGIPCESEYEEADEVGPPNMMIQSTVFGESNGNCSDPNKFAEDKSAVLPEKAEEISVTNPFDREEIACSYYSFEANEMQKVSLACHHITSKIHEKGTEEIQQSGGDGNITEPIQCEFASECKGGQALEKIDVGTTVGDFTTSKDNNSDAVEENNVNASPNISRNVINDHLIDMEPLSADVGGHSLFFSGGSTDIKNGAYSAGEMSMGGNQISGNGEDSITPGGDRKSIKDKVHGTNVEDSARNTKLPDDHKDASVEYCGAVKENNVDASPKVSRNIVIDHLIDMEPQIVDVSDHSLFFNSVGVDTGNAAYGACEMSIGGKVFSGNREDSIIPERFSKGVDDEVHFINVEDSARNTNELPDDHKDASTEYSDTLEENNVNASPNVSRNIINDHLIGNEPRTVDISDHSLFFNRVGEDIGNAAYGADEMSMGGKDFSGNCEDSNVEDSARNTNKLPDDHKDASKEYVSPDGTDCSTSNKLSCSNGSKSVVKVVEKEVHLNMLHDVDISADAEKLNPISSLTPGVAANCVFSPTNIYSNHGKKENELMENQFEPPQLSGREMNMVSGGREKVVAGTVAGGIFDANLIIQNPNDIVVAKDAMSMATNEQADKQVTQNQLGQQDQHTHLVVPDRPFTHNEESNEQKCFSPVIQDKDCETQKDESHIPEDVKGEDIAVTSGISDCFLAGVSVDREVQKVTVEEMKTLEEVETEGMSSPLTPMVPNVDCEVPNNTSSETMGKILQRIFASSSDCAERKFLETDLFSSAASENPEFLTSISESCLNDPSVYKEELGSEDNNDDAGRKEVIDEDKDKCYIDLACLFQEHDGNTDAKSDTTDSINVKRDAIYPQNITTQEVEEHEENKASELNIESDILTSQEIDLFLEASEQFKRTSESESKTAGFLSEDTKETTENEVFMEPVSPQFTKQQPVDQKMPEGVAMFESSGTSSSVKEVTRSTAESTPEGAGKYELNLLSSQQKTPDAKTKGSRSWFVTKNSSMKKQNSRSTLIMRTSKKFIHDMKENIPSSKGIKTGNMVAQKASSSRRALQDLSKK